MSLMSLLIILLMAISCRENPEKKESKTKVGLFSYGQSNLLIHIQPNEHLFFCGKHFQIGFEFFKKTAEHIGRNHYYDYSTSEDCPQDLNIHSIQFMDGFDPNVLSKFPRTDKSWANCKGNRRGYAASSYHWPDLKNRKIVFMCRTLSDSKFKNTLLHELGHLWGLCDQYDSGLGKDFVHHERCKHRSKLISDTVMIRSDSAPGMVDNFHADDIIGIRLMACRKYPVSFGFFSGKIGKEAVESNKKWREVLGDNTYANWQTPRFKEVLKEMKEAQRSTNDLFFEECG